MTLQDLRPLLDQFTGEGTVLSCYVDLGVSEGFRPDWVGLLKAKGDAIVKAIGNDGRAKQELEENRSAVRSTLESPQTHDARWAAVFSSVRRNFLRVFPLDAPVETDLVLDRSPYLVPLLAAMHRRREYLAVHTDTHRGRIYAATAGGARLLADIDEGVPRKQHSAGERWGYGQATIARHREDHILHYRKELVQELDRAWGAGSYAGVIFLGEHEVLERVREELPPRLTGKVVHEAPEPWYEAPAQVEESIYKAIDMLNDRAEAEVAPGFWDLLRVGGKAVVTGPRAVIDAVQGGRIGPDGYGYLVFGPDPREAVGRCVACRSLSAEVLGPCPKCQAPCAPGNLWEELLLTALQHRISARFVKDPQKLALYNGAVAVLPKVRAPEPAPAPTA